MRSATVERTTKETEVSLNINLDGTGKGEIATTIPFFDHMLNLFATHGMCDLSIRASGDTDVDYHHLVEDVGICLGQALKDALGDKRGISRYGAALVPMDESLCQVSIDISGRPYLVFDVDFNNKTVRDFDPLLFKEFFKALSDQGGITLHVNLMYGTNAHHMIEAVFKAFARSLHRAVSIDTRITGVMSTKGSL